MKTEPLRKVMIFWCLFIGIGAVAGATGMFVDVSGRAMGMDAMLPYFQVLPFADTLFQNFLFPGFSLLIVNGLTNLLAAWLLLRRNTLGATLGTVFGFTLMLWIVIQFIIFPANFMSTTYFIFGLLQCVCGHLLLISLRRDAFHFDEADYPNVGTDKSALVVYFSRLGYGRKIAYTYANMLGADIAEIKTPEKIDGLGGFLWAGRFAMHRWPMPVCELPVKLADYEKVVFVTPIWVFALSSPMRGFLQGNREPVNRAEYVIYHFESFQSTRAAAEEMNGLLGLTAERVTDLTCHFGQIVRQRDTLCFTSSAEKEA